MKAENRILGLAQLGSYIDQFLSKKTENFDANDDEFEEALKTSENNNSWFTIDNQKFALHQWAKLLTEDQIREWISHYNITENSKKIGLILAGNIPLVGFHDIICVILSNDFPLIKLSSKDKHLIPFLLKKWNEFSDNSVDFELVEKLQDYDAVIATGSNNTARYLEFYFKDNPSIIRKNRTSVGILSGQESNEELQLLANDIFQYFGLGCRNVTRLFIPENMELDRIFENFIQHQNIINHNKYANNYDYNRAVYLLNQDQFWDNNFVMLKEDDKLFSPLSVVHFTRYQNLDEVKNFVNENEENIQCIVASENSEIPSLSFGEAQFPALDTYADNVDTLKFLETL